MKVKTKYYDEVEVGTEEIIHFSHGLPGFESDQEYIYLQSEDSVFGSLQSCHRPETAFVVVSPFVVCPDYDFELPEVKQEELGITKLEEVMVLAIVTIPPGKPEEATVNLQAPIVLNTKLRKGAQLILSESGYPLRCKLWAQQKTAPVVVTK